MDREKLSAVPRQATGKGAVRKLREKGRVPAILYGKGIEGDALPLEIDTKEFTRLIDRAGVNVLIDLDVADRGKYTVMVKEVQRDVVKGDVLHVDFQRVSLTEEITATVPVELEGTPAGVAQGGILQFTARELEVRCLPTDLPESIKVDVSDLRIGQSLLVKDIEVSDAVTILTEPEEVVATVVAPTQDEEAEEEAKEAEEEEEKEH